jgi:hypothetical protein
LVTLKIREAECAESSRTGKTTKFQLDQVSPTDPRRSHTQPHTQHGPHNDRATMRIDSTPEPKPHTILFDSYRMTGEAISLHQIILLLPGGPDRIMRMVERALKTKTNR